MADQFSECEIADFKETFSRYSRYSPESGKEEIFTENLGYVMESLRQYPTEAELADMMFELNYASGIKFPEFLTMMARVIKKKKMMEAFRVYDRYREGYILADELRLVMRKSEEKLTYDQVDEMIRKVGINGDGQVRYEDFVKMMIQSDSSFNFN